MFSKTVNKEEANCSVLHTIYLTEVYHKYADRIKMCDVQRVSVSRVVIRLWQ